jgi:hypothetical protein
MAKRAPCVAATIGELVEEDCAAVGSDIGKPSVMVRVATLITEVLLTLEHRFVFAAPVIVGGARALTTYATGVAAIVVVNPPPGTPPGVIVMADELPTRLAFTRRLLTVIVVLAPAVTVFHVS